MATDPSGARGSTPGEGVSGPPPRELHPTADIRFVIFEIGKLTAQVERLIADVGEHGNKLDEVRHNISFVKGALWVIGALLAFLSLFAGWVISGHVSITLTP